MWDILIKIGILAIPVTWFQLISFLLQKHNLVLTIETRTNKNHTMNRFGRINLKDIPLRNATTKNLTYFNLNFKIIIVLLCRCLRKTYKYSMELYIEMIGIKIKFWNVL